MTQFYKLYILRSLNLVRALIHVSYPHHIAVWQLGRSNAVVIARVNRHNCVATVRRKCFPWIVHHREEVVGSGKVAVSKNVDFGKVASTFRCHIFDVNLDKLIPVGMVVHVREPECMDEFMHHGAFWHAASFRQWKTLFAPASSQIRSAAVAVDHFNVSSFQSSRDESHACPLLDLLKALSDNVFVALSWWDDGWNDFYFLRKSFVSLNSAASLIV